MKKYCDFCASSRIWLEREGENEFGHMLSFFRCDSCGSESVYVHIDHLPQVSVFDLLSGKVQLPKEKEAQNG